MNDAATPVFEQILRPFRDLGVMAATGYHLAMRDDLTPRKVQQASSR